MSILLNHHFAAFTILFAVALMLYLTGLQWEAEGVFFLGCLFEVAAWVAILTDRNRSA